MSIKYNDEARLTATENAQQERHDRVQNESQELQPWTAVLVGSRQHGAATKRKN